MLSHHLGKLEKSGMIRAVRGPRQARFFSPRITEEESTAINALRKDTPRYLLLALVRDDGLEFGQLVNRVKKSPSTVSLHLSKIVKDGLVEARSAGPKKRYHIKVRDLVNRLIENYRPSLLGKSVSGFEDIINSL